MISIRNENTRGVTGLCLDPADLACAKLVAGREKALEFVAALLRHEIVEERTLLGRLQDLLRCEDREAAQRNAPKVRARLA